MSIFDMFKGKAPEQAQQQQPQQQQLNNSGGQHIQNNPTVPNANNSPQQVPTPQNPDPQSPVANFNDLWKMEPTQPNQTPNFKIDPQQLASVSSKLNFASSISPDDLAKITAGGDGAVGALMNVLNTFGQNIFSTSAQFSSQMTESGYTSAQQAIDRGLPSIVNQQLGRNELFQSNPNLSSPEVKPLVMAIQNQIQQKYPNAAPGEVNSMVEKYFQRVGQVFQKEDPNAAAASKQNANFDFSQFL